MKKQPIIRYLAAACFFIVAWLNVFHSSIIFAALNLALGISILLRNKLISVISLGGCAVYKLYYIIISRSYPFYAIITLLELISYLLLLDAFYSPHKAKKLGIAAACVLYMQLFLNIFYPDGFQLYFAGVLECIANIAGAALFGFALWEESSPNPKENEAAPAKAQPQITNSYETLIRLKSLVDSGTITQEEFDAKKKQLLGL